jgi:hypothetical protein
MSLTLLQAAKAKLEVKRVEWFHQMGWLEWGGNSWNTTHEYRIAPEPKKKVKFLCWYYDGSLSWYKDDMPTPDHWKRCPAEDKEVELEP